MAFLLFYYDCKACLPEFGRQATMVLRVAWAGIQQGNAGQGLGQNCLRCKKPVRPHSMRIEREQVAS